MKYKIKGVCVIGDVVFGNQYMVTTKALHEYMAKYGDKPIPVTFRNSTEEKDVLGDAFLEIDKENPSKLRYTAMVTFDRKITKEEFVIDAMVSTDNVTQQRAIDGYQERTLAIANTNCTIPVLSLNIKTKASHPLICINSVEELKEEQQMSEEQPNAPTPDAAAPVAEAEAQKAADDAAGVAEGNPEAEAKADVEAQTEEEQSTKDQAADEADDANAESTPSEPVAETPADPAPAEEAPKDAQQ